MPAKLTLCERECMEFARSFSLSRWPRDAPSRHRRRQHVNDVICKDKDIHKQRPCPIVVSQVVPQREYYVFHHKSLHQSLYHIIAFSTRCAPFLPSSPRWLCCRRWLPAHARGGTRRRPCARARCARGLSYLRPLRVPGTRRARCGRWRPTCRCRRIRCRARGAPT